jgi:hypothetical protein
MQLGRWYRIESLNGRKEDFRLVNINGNGTWHEIIPLADS